MANTRSWLPELVTRISSIPEESVLTMTSLVMQDFCREALPWRELLTGYIVNAECPDVYLNPVDGRSEVLQVLQVFLGDQQLNPQAQSSPAAVAASGDPMAFTCEKGPTIVTLLPTPAVDLSREVSVYVALRPRHPELWVPDFFLTLHREAIIDGVLGRFYMQPNRPYTNERAASYHLQRYRNKTREAWSHANRGQTVDASGWAFPRFGA